MQLDGKNDSYSSYIMKIFFMEGSREVIFQVLRQNRLTPKLMIMLLLYKYEKLITLKLSLGSIILSHTRLMLN